MCKKILSLILTFVMLWNQAGYTQSVAGFNIAGHLNGIARQNPDKGFQPLHLRYFSYSPLTERFSFFADKGDLFKKEQVYEGRGTTDEGRRTNNDRRPSTSLKPRESRAKSRDGQRDPGRNK